MAPRPRKSSACVTLVLIGAAPDQAAARAKQYPTKEACIADWGNPGDWLRSDRLRVSLDRRHLLGQIAVLSIAVGLLNAAAMTY